MTLLEKAKAQTTRGRHNYDTLLPVAMLLRGKGWTYRELHEWLIAEGEHVHPNHITFAGSMSKRIKHHNKQHT